MKSIIPAICTGLVLVLAAPASAADRDLGEMADRIGRDIDRLNQQFVETARDYESKHGPLTLPGGNSLSVDDLMNADPVGLASRLGREYGDVVMGQFAGQTKIPDFDPETLCRKEAIDTESGPAGYNSCIMAEQKSYDVWKDSWRDLAEDVRLFCTDFADFHGGSYARLGECIESTGGSEPHLKSFKR